MIEIRFHGRGGQGAASGCTVFADAAFRGGKRIQAFPMFGVERRGAPVASFVRISDTEIRARHNIYTPDHVIVLSETLMDTIDCTDGLKPGGTITVNTAKSPEELGLKGDFKLYTVDATRISIEHGLGSITSPIVNTAMLGAAAKVTGLADIELLMQCIREAVPSKPEENAAAARDTYDAITP
ncbi:MAG TPA: 2-oxoacid:acceptor oxidoreductase family protein [bacterium]|nr:2-oxoacid:acceptor oxidoreductase family protein [bacterium]